MPRPEGLETHWQKPRRKILPREVSLAAGVRAARLMRQEDDPRTEAEISEHWTKLVAAAELTDEILRFLTDEALLEEGRELDATLTALTDVFNWSLANGMPSQKGRHPRQAFVPLSACSDVPRFRFSQLLARSFAPRGPTISVTRSRIDPQFLAITSRGPGEREPFHFLSRTRATSWTPVSRALVGLNLSGADLMGAWLVGGQT